MADNSGLMKYALLGIGGYLVYRYFLPAGPVVSTAIAPAAAQANVIDPIFTKLAAGNVTPTGPDGWNARFVSAGGPAPAPDPVDVFPGLDRSQPMNLAQYWAGMSAYLKAHMGLAGLGLFGELCRGCCGGRR